MKLNKLATALFLASSLVAGATHAETPQASAPPLPLALQLSGTKLDAEAIRKAVELELKRPVTLGPSGSSEGLLVIAHPNRTVTVSFHTETGLTRSRTIGIPEDTARSAEVIALLSGNLSRDEAAELLAALASKAAPAAATPAGPTSDTPEAKPAPTEPAPETKPSAASAASATPEPKRAAPSNPPPLTPTPFNVSLLAPLTLFPNTAQRSLNLELGLFYSHIGELHGTGLNAIALNTERTVHGLGIAGVLQRSGGLEGAQLSGVLNMTTGPAQGLSAAGVANLQQDFTGAQLAGALNRARKLRGVQAAGAVNIAEQISGLQIGVVNVAGDVDGLQLGVVNVAKHVKGTSIGLVSVADNGRVQPVLFASTQSSLNAALKFTVGPLYTQLGIGGTPSNHSWQYEVGLGGHFQLGRWFVEPGAHYSEVRDVNRFFGNELIEYGHYRVAAGVDLGKLSPFVGGGVLQRFAHTAGAPSSVPLTAEGFVGVSCF